MPFAFVQHADALAELSARVAESQWVAVDTEFTRERTFYARLGLLQLATDRFVACIDPLKVDLAPLLDVLYDARVLKVLHAGRQDLEVFHDLRGEVLRPVFDTQIAAALLGYADQIGYAPLVEAVTGVKLPKLHTRANWEARPLTPEQLRYAADDVAYLRDVYRALLARLELRGRLGWLQQECDALTDASLYRNDPETAHTRLNAGSLLRPDAQPLLKALIAWRERTAQARDRPRGWIASDAALLEIARAAPTRLDALRRMPHITSASVQAHGDEILRIVDAARGAPAERVWNAVPAPTPAEQDLARRMLARVQAVAQAADINPSIIATRRTIVSLVREHAGPLTRGWRHELIGAELLAMMEQAS